MRWILVEIPRRLLHELLAREVAKDPGHGLVAIEDAPIDRGAINPGQISLEEQAMPLLASAQGCLGAMTLHGVDEDLPTDSKQRHRLLAPRPRNRGRYAQRAEKGAVVDHRYDDDGVVSGLFELFALGLCFRWEVI